MQPKYLAILNYNILSLLPYILPPTLPLKANEKTISRRRKERWSSHDFFIFYYYFIII